MAYEVLKPGINKTNGALKENPNRTLLESARQRFPLALPENPMSLDDLLARVIENGQERSEFLSSLSPSNTPGVTPTAQEKENVLFFPEPRELNMGGMPYALYRLLLKDAVAGKPTHIVDAAKELTKHYGSIDIYEAARIAMGVKGDLQGKLKHANTGIRVVRLDTEVYREGHNSYWVLDTIDIRDRKVTEEEILKRRPKPIVPTILADNNKKRPETSPPAHSAAEPEHPNRVFDALPSGEEIGKEGTKMRMLYEAIVKDGEVLTLDTNQLVQRLFEKEIKNGRFTEREAAKNLGAVMTNFRRTFGPRNLQLVNLGIAKGEYTIFLGTPEEAEKFIAQTSSAAITIRVQALLRERQQPPAPIPKFKPRPAEKDERQRLLLPKPQDLFEKDSPEYKLYSMVLFDSTQHLPTHLSDAALYLFGELAALYDEVNFDAIRKNMNEKLTEHNLRLVKLASDVLRDEKHSYYTLAGLEEEDRKIKDEEIQEIMDGLKLKYIWQ